MNSQPALAVHLQISKSSNLQIPSSGMPFLHLNKTSKMKKVYFSLMTAFLALVSFAQETKKVDVDISTGTESNWYASPWVWVVGAAVFILLLVALTRGGRRAD